ncbi:MFS transporter [Arsenicicoccus dermatophilus]|uniref:MFS transporter n=1 Tax=Arsenicicoccus dermatophilus TaxID=1076331 RepID=UPI003916CF1B
MTQTTRSQTPSPSAAPPSPPAAAHRATPAPTTLESGMTHKEVLEALSGLMLGMFVAILSSTVVSNALPTIVTELHGSQSGYTWVVTATLLATTISTPIWGKLSDLVSKKLLVQLALVLFAAASMAAGLSQNMGTLITMRVFQGLGAGGLTALSQVILAMIVSPRERGRYSGYLGATFALGTVAGPLIGGAITEHLSWRWCFYVGVPFAVLAILVLQKTLHLPTVRRRVHIDYLGAILLAGGVSSLLVWVTLAGDSFDWWSWQTGAMVGGGMVLLALTVMAEQVAPEPMIPLRLFRKPTIVLSSLASLFVGIGMFAGTVFLGQYFQLARAQSPMEAGIATMPMILGLFLSSMISGQVITRTGRWKAWLCAGGLLMTSGLGLLGLLAYDTTYWIVAVWMFLLGTGLGMMMQNLVLAVQNEVPPSDLGAASSFVAFARSMGGAIGVSALGALLGTRLKDHLVEGFAAARINPGSALGGGLPHVSALPVPVRSIVQVAYGQGLSEVFLAAAPFALVAFLITLFIRETELRRTPLPEAGQQAAEESGVEQVWNAPADHDHEERLTRAEWREREGMAGSWTAGATRTLVEVSSADDTEEAPSPDSTLAAAGEDAVAVVGHALVGVVRRTGGLPVPGAWVTVTDASGGQVGRTRTDDDGSFHLALGSGGAYLVITSADGIAPTASLREVGSRPVQHDVTLRGTARLAGRVLQRGTEGDHTWAVPDAQVILTDATGEVVDRQVAGAQGEYAFGELDGGSYVLTVRAGAHRPAAHAITVGSSQGAVHDVVLAPRGTLEGRVVDAADERPVDRAVVTLTDGSGAVAARTETAPDGGYRLADVPAGRYLLTASGYAPVSCEVDVVDGGSAEHTIQLGQVSRA